MKPDWLAQEFFYAVAMVILGLIISGVGLYLLPS